MAVAFALALQAKISTRNRKLKIAPTLADPIWSLSATAIITTPMIPRKNPTMKARPLPGSGFLGSFLWGVFTIRFLLGIDLAPQAKRRVVCLACGLARLAGVVGLLFYAVSEVDVMGLRICLACLA